jgi:hypothetical protein
LLIAIYEDQFTLVPTTASTMALKRYKITIREGSEIGSLSVGDLHVFIRPGYPLHCAPLFLMTSVDVPWPFLRKINVEMIRRTADCGGGPLIFVMVSQLIEFYPIMWADYKVKENAIEFEEIQRQ